MGADKEEDAGEEDSKDVDPATPLNKKEKRKTKKQRRKAREQRTVQQKIVKKKTAKQRAHEFEKLSIIGKEISAREQELAERWAKKEHLQQKREKAGITHQIG